MRPLYWILPPGQTVPIQAVGALAWARAFEQGNRVLTQTPTRSEGMVSTVFLGLDHNFMDDGPPLLWETMVFSGPLDGIQRRHSSYEQAERGHRAAVRLVARYEYRKWWYLVWWLVKDHYRMWRQLRRQYVGSVL